MSKPMIQLTVDTEGKPSVMAVPQLTPGMVGLYIVELAARYSKACPSTREDRMAFQRAQQLTDERGTV